MQSARLVAEALRVVPDPVITALPAVRRVAPAMVSTLREAAIAPARHGGPAPAFLRPEQIDAWRRAMAALDGWDGALLAEPVGCGKTWIALAVIAARTGGATVIGPAALSAQWRLAATRAAVPISYHSLERLSRGRLPPGARLVVIDEAHRLRHPETHRVRTLAPWLVGREVLLLTATPMVNRRRDLLNLLALLVPDDALALDGVSSLRDLAVAPRPPDALRRLVIRTARPGHGPSREETVLPVSPVERARCARVVSQVNRLVLSGDPGVRALLRMVLLDAGASSDAAWRAALRRYRDLLLHSREAGGASRSALRHFVGDALGQLVLWPMMGAIDRSAAPPPEDLVGVLAALDAPATDAAWIDPLARRIRDGVATICFCRHRATAVALRRRLGAGTAWVTGAGAGIGNHRVARESLLAVFGPNRRQWPHPIPPPTVLVATEVLAEGIDLQGASRVVHVDQPWHAMRLEQRTGRVDRLGQVASRVEVLHRRPASPIERELALSRRIRRKQTVSRAWLEHLERPAGPHDPPTPALWLAVIADSRRRLPEVVVALDDGRRSGGQCFAIRADMALPRPIGPLDAAPERHRPPTCAERERATRLAAAALRQAIGHSSSRPAGRHQLIAWLLELARPALRRRDRRTLARLDAWLSVATRPGTLGTEMMLRQLPGLDEPTLMAMRPPMVGGRSVPGLRWAVVVLPRQEPTPLP